MKKNMANFDRILRSLIGIVLLFLSVKGLIFGPTTLVISMVLLLTSLFGFCPMYALFGISSRKIN
jgi:hypothetical protein